MTPAISGFVINRAENGHWKQAVADLIEIQSDL